MALRNIKVQVSCDSPCSECTTARGVTSPNNTVSTTGVLIGSIVENALGRAVWTEGTNRFVNFQFDDAQLVPGLLLRPCDVAVVCGSVVDLIDRQALIATPCSGTRTCFNGIDTPSVDYTYDVVTGTHSAAVRISITANNRLIVNPDGLFVDRPVVNPIVRASAIAKLIALGLTLAEASSLYDS